MLKIYGSSDDCIEIEGDINDEFYAVNDEPTLLGFSDGTVLEIEYNSDGIWRIAPVYKGSATYNKEFEATNSDSDDYSDVVTLTSSDPNLKWWVMCNNGVSKQKKK